MRPVRTAPILLAGLLVLGALPLAPPASAVSCVSLTADDARVTVCDLDEDGMPDHVCVIAPGRPPCR
jgi:hypothetical protein